MTGSRRDPQRGFAALELVVGVALLLVPTVATVLVLPGWAARRTVAELAARDAARRVALSGVCDEVGATAAVRAVATAGGVDPADVVVTLDCAPGTVLTRDAPVGARVTVAVPALTVPALGSVGAWRTGATRTLVVDPYAAVP